VPVGLLAWAAFPLLLFVFVILVFAAFIAGVWIMPAVVFGFRTLNWADGLHFVSALVWFGWLLSVLAYSRLAHLVASWAGTLAFLMWIALGWFERPGVMQEAPPIQFLPMSLRGAYTAMAGLPLDTRLGLR